MSFQYSIGLQVWHPHADPDMVERGFALEASHKQTAGKARKTPKGTPLSGTYRESYCHFDLASGEDGKLAACFKGLVDKLEAKQSYIEEIKQSGGRLSFFVGWTCGEHGEVFDVELLSAIASLGIDLGNEPYRVKQY